MKHKGYRLTQSIEPQTAYDKFHSGFNLPMNNLFDVTVEEASVRIGKTSSGTDSFSLSRFPPGSIIAVEVRFNQSTCC